MNRKMTIRYGMWEASTSDIGMESKSMDLNMKVLIWNMMGCDESDWDGLEQNG